MRSSGFGTITLVLRTCKQMASLAPLVCRAYSLIFSMAFKTRATTLLGRGA